MSLVIEEPPKPKRRSSKPRKSAAPPPAPEPLVVEEAPAPPPPPRDPVPMATSLAQETDLLADFTVEAREHIATIENSVLILERDPQNKEAIHAVFRAFHSIKGLAGFLDLDQIQLLTHEVETVLDGVRNERLQVNSALVDVILQSVDYLSHALMKLDAVIQGQPPVPFPVDPKLLEKVRSVESTHQAAEEAAPTPVVEAAPTEAAPRSSAKVEAARVKVDTLKLDALVEMVGELVVAQSLLRHDDRLKSDINGPIAHKVSQMARITSEIQQITMSMRMVPIGQLFQKTARLARDLTRKAGKSLEFVTAGEDTELDRNIVEELGDPLVHMIRNSIDHGLESPEDRIKAGKNPTGQLTLKASHQAGIIVVEVVDDGRGLDAKKIRARAIDRGLIKEETEYSDEDIYNLIFVPGFSTASQVTDVSGRGVGMDVVKRHIERLRGRIEIRTVLGQGTTFLLKLPLTLAIIDGLIVGVGSERYILPIVAVKEMFRPTDKTVHSAEGSREMVRLRDRVLPVVRLSERFGIAASHHNLRDSLLIVTETENRQFCLVVDELIGRQEVVIKSLGAVFGNVPGVAGGAILGDGRVGLILDPAGVFQADSKEPALHNA